MNIRILRVLGVRSQSPAVVAHVDGLSVRWDVPHGWTCDCLTEADDLTCPHVDALVNLIDPRVFGAAQ